VASRARIRIRTNGCEAGADVGIPEPGVPAACAGGIDTQGGTPALTNTILRGNGLEIVAALLRALVEAGVEFVVIGGAAATAHGSTRLTLDLDVVYRRTPENMDRLVAALRDLEPYLRGAPPGLPFRWDRETLERGLNFALTTARGDIDLLGEITEGGGYDELRPHTIGIELLDLTCRCLDLETLIRVKRAAERPKDLEVIAELRSGRSVGETHDIESSLQTWTLPRSEAVRTLRESLYAGPQEPFKAGVREPW
jgi:hypothetical protein